MSYLEECKYSIRLIEKLKALDTARKLDFVLINKAIHWARKYHGSQMRKSGEPFYSHPLEVAYMIADYNLKTEVIVASILHDIVEDTEVTVEMILENFSQRIAEMVDRLTRDRPDGTKLSVEEIINNAYHQKDREVLLIKLIDRLHNMETLSSIPLEKIKKTIKETLNFFITTSMYIGHRDLEEGIYKICYNNFTLPCSSSDIDLQFSEVKSHLDSLEKFYTHQIASQVFQNVINQVGSKK